MTVWLREIVGWITLILGVVAAILCYHFLVNRWFIEAMILTASVFLLLRTGTHLLKVASAARAVGQLRTQTESRARIKLGSTSPTASGRVRDSVIPGPK